MCINGLLFGLQFKDPDVETEAKILRRDSMRQSLYYDIDVQCFFAGTGLKMFYFLNSCIIKLKG
jgi:hypothetical protein